MQTFDWAKKALRFCGERAPTLPPSCTSEVAIDAYGFFLREVKVSVSTAADLATMWIAWHNSFINNSARRNRRGQAWIPAGRFKDFLVSSLDDSTVAESLQQN